MVGSLRKKKNKTDNSADDAASDTALLDAENQSETSGTPDADVPLGLAINSETESRRRRALEHRHLTKVFFLRKELLAENAAAIHILQLRHPVNKCATYYICNHAEQVYYELVRYGEPNRSWLVQDTITIDGSIFMTMHVDPLFLILPYVHSACGDRFVPLDQALMDQRCPEIVQFADVLPMSQILLIADQKGPADMKAVRFSVEKTLDWLAFKCDRYVKLLKARGHRIEAGARSQTYVKSDKSVTDPGDDARLSLTISILIDYLPKELHQKLLVRVGAESVKPRSATSNAKTTKKRPSAVVDASSTTDGTETDERTTKGRPGSDSSSGDSPAARPEEKKQTAKEKALAKAASGTKNLFSFFKRV